MRSEYGRASRVPTTFSGTPPAVTISRSFSPASVSMDERNEPAPAVPAKSMASTTATPSAIANNVKETRTSSPNHGRTNHPSTRSSPDTIKYCRRTELLQVALFKFRTRRNHVKTLEKQSAFCPATPGLRIILKRCCCPAIHQHRAGSRKVHGARQAQQCRLAAPAATHQRNELPARNLQRQIVKRPDRLIVREIVLGDVLERENRHWGNDGLNDCGAATIAAPRRIRNISESQRCASA